MTGVKESSAKAIDPDSHSTLPTSHQTPVVSDGDTFLSFEYDKDSCPDRFFAAHEMKP